jgi:hypothetical protein
VAATYAIAVSWTYAPPGASGWCAWSSYFEPSGPKGDFTILVARFDNDAAGASDRLAAEVSRQYGLPVMRTCVHATANSDDSSSAGTLLTRYNAGLLLSGTVAKGGQIALQVSSGGGLATTTKPMTLTQDTIPQAIAKQLQIYLIQAIEESSLHIAPSSGPAANLADYADRVDALVPRIDWTDDPSQDDLQRLERLRDKIGIYAAAGHLMLVAALASNDGARAKKAVAYFALASSTFDGSGDPKPVVAFEWQDNYSFALLTDARLNKAVDSAKLAASRYLKAYQDEETVAPYEVEELYPLAGAAASAAAELYSITQSQDDEQSAIRLACESVLQLRYYTENRPVAEQRAAPLAKQGLSQGSLPEAPPPEQTEGYKILVRLGKNPSAIFAPGPEMKLKDCETF